MVSKVISDSLARDQTLAAGLVSRFSQWKPPGCLVADARPSERAATRGDDVLVLTISMHLPFTQKWWCGAEGIDRVVMLSDFKNREVGQNYGLRDNGLLARAVFVIAAARQRVASRGHTRSILRRVQEREYWFRCRITRNAPTAP